MWLVFVPVRVLLMGVRVLHDVEDDQACLYCSTTDWAFGPVFSGDTPTRKDAQECALAFLAWLDHHKSKDARRYTDQELELVVSEWRGAEDRFGWEFGSDGRTIQVEP